MEKLRFFLNDPRGKTWEVLEAMLPRLGGLNGVEIEVISKPHAEYQNEQYQRSGLPPAPAVTLEDEVVAQGGPINEERLRDLIANQQSV